MASTARDSGWLFSPLAEEPDLREVVDLFVAELPDRAQTVLRTFQTQDVQGLRRAAHQLKGAAGSYGFDSITAAAARLEDAVIASQPEEELLGAIHELVDLCRRARGGTRSEIAVSAGEDVQVEV
jgi:histidine phosphotransfer protein HptB